MEISIIQELIYNNLKAQPYFTNKKEKERLNIIIESKILDKINQIDEFIKNLIEKFVKENYDKISKEDIIKEKNIIQKIPLEIQTESWKPYIGNKLPTNSQNLFQFFNSLSEQEKNIWIDALLFIKEIENETISKFEFLKSIKKYQKEIENFIEKSKNLKFSYKEISEIINQNYENSAIWAIFEKPNFQILKKEFEQLNQQKNFLSKELNPILIELSPILIEEDILKIKEILNLFESDKSINEIKKSIQNLKIKEEIIQNFYKMKQTQIFQNIYWNEYQQSLINEKKKISFEDLQNKIKQIQDDLIKKTKLISNQKMKIKEFENLFLKIIENEKKKNY
ncbi:hypothetical protein M0811_05942 [Anaeramoeba ignava]|uniref:Uncharacterized protein n=1 Tax=Anaeramoeba ignava TaxID=1746090 RepID=A0A9Q0LRX7_ANAIG|nr:hypothetical protein M0811_05942 [Anaeramoeba ignava]